MRQQSCQKIYGVGLASVGIHLLMLPNGSISTAHQIRNLIGVQHILGFIPEAKLFGPLPVIYIKPFIGAECEVYVA